MSHPACNSRRMSKCGYPTRLLDLGSSATEYNLHLVDVKDIREPVTYLALSHCWGGNIPVMLELDTIERFKDGIDMEELPRSFKHAVHMTRYLSVRYLWIDSLCIIQDSLQDWEQEAGQMRDVYTNALLTIAATGAKNSAEGLNFQRDPTILEFLMVHIPPPSHYHGIYALFDAHSWETNVKLAPLTQRAWVVQERLLSPCVLHFGRDQIAWECQELQACEMFPNGLPETLGLFGGSRYKALLASRNNDFITWTNIVKTYSQCQLSQEGDICIALAGLAEEFRSWTKTGKYVAGLWAIHLVSQMCWATDELENALRHVIPKRPLQYRAPSWSWMSIKSSITFYLFTRECFMFEILDYKIENTSENEFGAIKGGHILGCGMLKHAKWCLSNDSKVKELIVDGYTIESLGYWHIRAQQVIMDFGMEEPSCDVFCLPLVKNVAPDGLQVGFYVGLILALVDGGRDIYRRVGCFYFDPSLGNRIFLHQGSRNEDQASPAKSKVMIV